MTTDKADFFTSLKVYLVTKPTVDWVQVAKFLEDEGVPPIPDSIRAGEYDTSAAVIEIAARLCYMSFGKGRRDIGAFIDNLLSSKDGSVLEHVNYGFVFTGVSRSLSHELVRHRAGFAYSQRSQRYVDESGSSFVMPPILSNSDEAKLLLQVAAEEASACYGELVDRLESSVPEGWFSSQRDHRKAVRQAARSVLPNATETKIFVTANVRAWRHFIEMRANMQADWEIRALAMKVLEILQLEAPLLFGDFRIEKLPDWTTVATPMYSKV